jgi:ABC-type Na+ efflux pump permease subunit
MSTRRVRAIFRKELREYRHNGFIIASMAILPLFFVASALAVIVLVPASAAESNSLLTTGPLLYMLGIPTLVPGTVAAYAVVGEREQGTLEPVLTTPIRREEFVLGKALAAAVPSLAISYAWCGFVLVCTGLLAHPAVASEVYRSPALLAQLLFTPLLAGLSICVGIAISARSRDIRVAQQLSLIAMLPPLAATTLIAFGVIHASLGLALVLAVALLVLDGLGWRVMSAMVDRERLVTGTRS